MPKIKRFDSEAILGRMVKVLQSKDNWSKLQKDGATYQLLEAITEPLAELGRYGEYLLQELKWDTSRNYSSTKHMARLVGKKLDRKHSAVGSIIVSHSDLEGVARYSFLGLDNFSVDSESDYDNLYKDETLTETLYTHSLVPWTSKKNYTIPLGAIFNTKSNVTFICAETRKIKPFSSSWKTINLNSDSLLGFKASDGWNNYKYLTVPIVQGIQKTVNLGYSTGLAGQTFLVSTLDIEAADNYYTRQFCYIEVEDLEGNITKWSEIYHLQLADSTDRVFEIDILDDLSGTIIKFGDSITGATPPQGAKITFHYLETLGTKGNVTTLYDFQNEISGAELPADSEYLNLSIGCQNMWPITGGKDLETLAEFKENAETAYAKNYEILHTYEELLDSINSISPIPLLKVRTSTFYENTQINSTKVLLSKIGITGLSTSMQPLNSMESSLFEKVLNSELNKNVLSNKYIKYIAPKIIEVDSYVDIEPKMGLQSKEDFQEDLENHLLALYGKSNINPVDCYKQADLLRASLQHSSIIDSIQTTNLLTTNFTNVFFGRLGSQADFYFLFQFDFPELITDVLSMEGFCNKSLLDGNEVCYIFNVSIVGSNNTLIVSEYSKEENDKILFEQSDYFTDTTLKYLYKNSLTNSFKYDIKPLYLEKHTFSKKELQSSKNLKTSTTEPFSTGTDLKGVYFYVSRSANSPQFFLALNAQVVANQLGYKSTVTKDNISRIYNNLLSAWDSSNVHITVSFEPTDKTVNINWDSVMYYNNITVNVSESSS